MSTLPLAPLQFSETEGILRAVAQAHRYLGELKGAVSAMPVASILIDTLAIQEAQRSSEIENIVTTTDDVYQSDPQAGLFPNVAAKEVHRYVTGLKLGYERIRQNGILRLKDVLDLQGALVEHRSGLRAVPGTILRNEQTGDVVYEPPQDPAEIKHLMTNLLDQFHLTPPPYDPLVQMAILHHQFESIHPFYDGNGRTGRILNSLYLVLHGLQDLPVLYLSRYIVRTKGEYYERLQAVRDRDAWHEWVQYIVTGVEETARDTLERVRKIADLMERTRENISSHEPGLDRPEILLNLFQHPYTKREYLQRELGVSRPTATKYLNTLAGLNVLVLRKRGRTNYYINQALVDILTA